MKLRVIAGEGAPGLPDAEGLITLYRGPGLTVEGTADVVVLASGDRRTFIAGHVAGLRTRAGALLPVGPRLDEVAGRGERYTVGDWREALEGRFVVVRAGADGCEIGADRFGRCDVYYQRAGAHTVVATELGLLPVARSAGEYDQAALAHVASAYGWRPPKRHTLYKAVHRLGVGETARLGSGRLEVTEAPFRPAPVGAYTMREMNEYADILLDAIAAAGSQHGNVVYLSSGWDSTSLLACLVKIFGARKVRAVIGRMQYSERSGVINQFELDRARAVADYFGVRLDVAEFDYRKEIPAVFERLQPLLRTHQLASGTIATHGILADHVARTTGGDEAVFAGEISDGAHNLGYSQFATIFHPVLDFREYADKMGSYLYGPTAFAAFQRGELTGDLIYSLFRGRAGDGVFDALASDADGRRRQFLSSFFLRGYRLPLWSLRNQRMLTDAGRRLYADEMEGAYFSRAAQEATPETLYAWYLHLYNSFHWQGSTVSTMAATADAFGLHLVLPFWDARIQDFLSAMPESWGRGLDLNPTKYPLKWMLRHRVDYPMHLQVGPHSYLYDVDHTFSHAVEMLYHSAFTRFYRARLKERRYRRLFSADVFDLAYMDETVDRYLAGTEARGSELGDLVTLCWLATAGWYGDA
jgi:hypothetical protein